MQTLKEILRDEARYRELRRMIDSGKYYLCRRDNSVAMSSAGVDAVIDGEIDKWERGNGS